MLSFFVHHRNPELKLGQVSFFFFGLKKNAQNYDGQVNLVFYSAVKYVTFSYFGHRPPSSSGLS